MPVGIDPYLINIINDKFLMDAIYYYLKNTLIITYETAVKNYILVINKA